MQTWLRQILNTEAFECVPIVGDASARRYTRVLAQGRCFVVMECPAEEQAKLKSFVQVADLLWQQGLSVPQILEMDLEQGCLLLSDLGEQTYLQALSPTTMGGLYQDALQALQRIQSIPTTAGLEQFSQDVIERELALFYEWYLKTHRGLHWGEGTAEAFAQANAWISQELQAQPQVFTHLDYHSRNLMVLPQNNPGILDFQDARQGPLTYDLVSLLKDCYIDWPREQVLDLLESFRKQLPTDWQTSTAVFQRWFDVTGLQRHLRVLGVFARLHHQRGKSGYLQYMPRILHYVQETCAMYPELKAFRAALDSLQV